MLSSSLYLATVLLAKLIPCDCNLFTKISRVDRFYGLNVCLPYMSETSIIKVPCGGYIPHGAGGALSPGGAHKPDRFLKIST